MKKIQSLRKKGEEEGAVEDTIHVDPSISRRRDRKTAMKFGECVATKVGKVNAGTPFEKDRQELW